MGLGYRSRFQPLLATEIGIYTRVSSLSPYRIAHHMRVLGFSKCWIHAHQPTTTITVIPAFVLHARTCIMNVIYSCTRDRQTQSHKRKQGLLGLPPVGGGKSRHLQSGTKYFAPFDEYRRRVTTLRRGKDGRGVVGVEA